MNIGAQRNQRVLNQRRDRQWLHSYPVKQRFLALSSRWEMRGTSARNRTISYHACANYVSICHAKCHFLSLKLNVTSSYFMGTACDNFGAKKTSVCRQLLFLPRMCRLKLQQKLIEWKFPNAVWFATYSVNLTANSSFFQMAERVWNRSIMQIANPWSLTTSCMPLYCSFDMQGAFIPVSGYQTCAFGDYFLPIIIIIYLPLS